MLLRTLALAYDALQASFWGETPSMTSQLEPNPVPVRTIIDILSETPEFSTFLHLLQTRDLIPTVNTAWNATLLAPVNSAFVEVDLDSVTRDQILYMLLNETVVLEQSLGTLIAPTFLVTDGIAATIELSSDSVNHGESDIVERNLMGSRDRGVVHGVSKLVSTPDNLCSQVFQRDDASIFTQMISLGDLCGQLGKEITMFVPNNKALTTMFSAIELTYLFGGAAATDRLKLLQRHTMRGLLDPQNLPTAVEMLDGSVWSLDESLMVNSTYQVVDPLICALDGVYNIYSNVFGTVITLTPEKYILALRGYAFVRALNLYGYHYLIDGSYNESQAVLVPVMAPVFSADTELTELLEAADFDYEGVAPSSYIELNDDDILYQFLEPFALEGPGNKLLHTKMSLKSGKYPQRAQLHSSVSGNHYVNWQKITSTEFEIGNTTIMTIDGKLIPPSRLQMAIGPLLLSSYSLTYLENLDLLDLPIDHSWTLLLPTREAWEKYILLKYFFDYNPDKLQTFFNSMIFSTPLYSDSQNQTVETFDGRKVGARIYYEDPEETHVCLEIDGSHYDTEVSDVLFDNGVVHCVTNLNVPQEIDISAHDLIESGQRSVFIDLLEKVGLSEVLVGGNNYTIIVPDPDALAKANYTVDSPDYEIESLLKLHIIEGNPIIDFRRGETVETVAGEPLVLQKVSPNTYSITLLSGYGQRVFINGWGETNGRVSSGTTILFIDSLISPEWVEGPILAPPFRFKTHLLLLLGIVMGVVIVGLVIVGAMWFFIDDKVLEAQAGAGYISDHQQQQQQQQQQGGQDDDSDESNGRTQPIRTTHQAQGREFGQHLDLP